MLSTFATPNIVKLDTRRAVSCPRAVHVQAGACKTSYENAGATRGRDIRLVEAVAVCGVVAASQRLSKRGRRRAIALRASRPGIIAPSDPVLQDASQFGKGLYSHADFSEWFQTAPDFDWLECEIEGELPSDLAGVLYQVGPGRYTRGDKIYSHFLDGDGYVSAWQFRDGKVMCKGDYVRTPEYEQEEAANKIMFRRAFGTAREGGVLANAFDINSPNLANTNIISWGGRLLALYEAAHPTSLNDQDLSFIRYDNLDGALRPGLSASSGNDIVDQVLGMGGDAFTAHPKMDPVRRSLVGYSWTTKEKLELEVLEFDEQFRRVHEQEPDAKVILSGSDAQPHDFGLSDKWCVFFENWLQMAELPKFLLGLQGPVQCLRARPDLAQKIHLSPRRKGEPNIEIEGVQGGFDIHVPHCHDGAPLAHYDDVGQRADKLVTVYTTGWDYLPEGSFLGGWGEGDDKWPFELPRVALASDFQKIPPVRLLRHVIDTERQELVDRRVVPGCEDICMEHPTTNPSWTGSRQSQYIYMAACNDVGLPSPMSGYARADLQSGEVQKWWAGNRCFTDEPHFVPCGSCSVGTWTPGAPVGAEDDGWILGIMGDVSRKQSCLCIFDASHIDSGPVCKVWLPYLLPHGLHGSFVPAKA